jgi:hypothetical protein
MTVRPHLELPRGWQAVALSGGTDPAGGTTELAAVREPLTGGGEFTPNLAAVTHLVPAQLPVLVFADRVLGRMSRTAQSVAVFKNAAQPVATASRPGELDSVVVRGLRLVTRPEADAGEQLLVQFQVHAGVSPEPGADTYPVVQLVLTCAAHQRELVEPEFQSIVDNFGVEAER